MFICVLLHSNSIVPFIRTYTWSANKRTKKELDDFLADVKGKQLLMAYQAKDFKLENLLVYGKCWLYYHHVTEYIINQSIYQYKSNSVLLESVRELNESE